MSANQKIILAIFIVYLALNAAIGIIFSNRQNKKQHTSSEKKFFIGGRNMNGLLLAMTTMATYTSVSSFISGPGAAGLTYGYAQAWIATVQVPITFLVLGVLGNKLALVSRRTGAVTVVGYLKARYKSDVLVIVTSLLMVAFFMANVVMYVMELGLMKAFVRMVNVKLSFLFPAIVACCVLGVYTLNNRMFDVWVMIIFGFVGYLLICLGIDMAPVILGFILGPLIEKYMRMALISANGNWADMFNRPVSVFFVVIAILFVVVPVIKKAVTHGKEKA